MTRSRENCSTNNHRLTCERQEGGFSMRNALMRNAQCAMRDNFDLTSCARNKGVFLLRKSRLPKSFLHCGEIAHTLGPVAGLIFLQRDVASSGRGGVVNTGGISCRVRTQR